MLATQERQEQDNWCWIACFNMACSFFGKTTVQQCATAQRFLGISNCCPSGSNATCDQRLSDTDIPRLYQSASLQAASSTIDDAAFQQTLASGSLVLLLLAFPATYHFVLLSGYGSGTYTVNDPAYNAPSDITYDQLSSAYQSGGSIAQAWTIS